jgi:hypothetical protein
MLTSPAELLSDKGLGPLGEVHRLTRLAELLCLCEGTSTEAKPREC